MMLVLVKRKKDMLEEMQHLTSVYRKISADRTESDRPPKLPPELRGKDSENLAQRLTLAYRVVVEQRGMEYVDLPEAHISETIADIVKWLLGPIYRTTLFLQGTVGNGKTSILTAISLVYTEAHKSHTICTTEDIYEHYRLYRIGENNRYDYYKQRDTLLIDDLGVEPDTFQSFGVEFTPIQSLLGYRYKHQLTTIMTTNLSDRLILERYGDRVDDRFWEMCSVLHFRGPSFRKLLANEIHEKEEETP